MEIINATDGYKLGHHRMYPEGTEQVYSNWTPRSNKYFPEATEGSVVFGIQYLIKEYLIKQFEKNFFNLPKKEAVEMFYRRVNNFVGIESVGFAIKATACVVNGELKEIFKHPKTDDGTKNSLKGLIAVYEGLDGKYTAIDQVSIEEEKDGYLETVFEDGILKKEYSLEEIRQRIDNGL